MYCLLASLHVTWLPIDLTRPNFFSTHFTRIGYEISDTVEPYMPDRALRQHGFVQTNPEIILRPSKALRPWSARLMIRGISIHNSRKLFTAKDREGHGANCTLQQMVHEIFSYVAQGPQQDYKSQNTCERALRDV